MEKKTKIIIGVVVAVAVIVGLLLAQGVLLQGTLRIGTTTTQLTTIEPTLTPTLTTRDSLSTITYEPTTRVPLVACEATNTKLYSSSNPSGAQYSTFTDFVNGEVVSLFNAFSLPLNQEVQVKCPWKIELSGTSGSKIFTCDATYGLHYSSSGDYVGMACLNDDGYGLQTSYHSIIDIFGQIRYEDSSGATNYTDLTITSL